MKHRGRLKAGAIALMLAAALALGMVDPAWQTRSVATPTGEQTGITLPDGSVILLNADTQLDIDSRLFSRRFTLREGEAAFRAVHGWRPFVVQARRTQVRSMGTVFNIRNEVDGAQVSVQEGAVEVTVDSGRVTVRASQTIETRAGMVSAPQPADPRSTAWQESRLDGTPQAGSR
jgi:transmembrane sensor